MSDSVVPILQSCPLIDAQGERVSNEQVLADVKLIGLYFTASWCPPCRQFSPTLDALAQNSDSLRIIVVTADRTEGAFHDYIRAYPTFYAIPFAAGARSAIQRMMGATMLPTLVIVNAQTGAVVTSLGRQAVSMNRANCVKDWENGRAGILSSTQWMAIYLAVAVTLTLLYYQVKMR